MDNTFFDVKIRLNSKTDDIDVFNEISKVPKRLRAKKIKNLAMKGFYGSKMHVIAKGNCDDNKIISKSKTDSIKKVLGTI